MNWQEITQAWEIASYFFWTFAALAAGTVVWSLLLWVGG